MNNNKSHLLSEFQIGSYQIDYDQIKIFSKENYSLLIIRPNFQESSIDDQLIQSEQLVQHQLKINYRLRYFGLIGILIDIICYEIIADEKGAIIVCKTMKLSEQRGRVNLGLANCLHLYTGLELKGVRPTIIMHIDDLGMNKILPFTYLTSVLNEDNEQLIIYNDQLVQFKLISEITDIHILKYLELTSGVRVSDVLKNCKVRIEGKEKKYLNQNDEVIAISDQRAVEIWVTIKNQQYTVQGEWNNLQEIINQRINGLPYDSIPNELFVPIDDSILCNFNIYEFDQRGQLIFLNGQLKDDIKSKVIIINKSIKRSVWFCALRALLVMLKISIQNAYYQDQRLVLRTLCQLNSKIPTSSVEIQADLREEDFNLILDQCNLNPHLESFVIDGSNFRDSILSGLTQGTTIKSIKELSFKGCPLITDEGISLLHNFGVTKLDVSYTQVSLALPQYLQQLNIAYSKFKEETLLLLFREKSLMGLMSLNISGLATDALIQVIFSCHYKELRVLIANDCKLSLSVFHFIHDSKHVKQLELLSFQNSITDVEESIFKKNGYALLGASKAHIAKLDLTNCYISDKLVKSFVESVKLLSNLRVLSLSGCRNITDKSIHLLCFANPTITAHLKSLDISNLPYLTESSIEYLTQRQMKNLTDLNIANSSQIKAENLKKAFDSGKFNQLKYLGISGPNDQGGQAELFKFGIPELCAYYVKNHLAEIQLIEIFVSAKQFASLVTIILNLLQSQVLTKINCNERLVLDSESLDMIRTSPGCEKLLLNNKPMVFENKDQPKPQLTPNQFYEKLLKQNQEIIIHNEEIRYLNLMYNFKTIEKINLKNTEIIDSEFESICLYLQLTEINLKKCKRLTFKSLTYLKQQSEQLVNLDFRGTLFEKQYQTLKYLSHFTKLQSLNGGKLDVEIINIAESVNVIQDLRHLPQIWLQIDRVKSFKMTIRAHYIQTFKFIFKTLSLILNKNQDFIQRMSIQLYQFKVIQDKSLQLFHNSLLNLQTLQQFHLGFSGMKNISFLTLRNMIISLSGLESLKTLSLNLDDCEVQYVDEEVFLASNVFEGIRNMRLQSFSFSSNDTITHESQLFTSLFKYLIDIDCLKSITLSFQRHTIEKESLMELFQTLKELNLNHLSLNFEQSGTRYSKSTWAELLEVLRMNYSLLNLELNFNHCFELTDMDLHNIIDELYCMKLQSSCVSIIGCYHNSEKTIKDFVSDEVKNYYFYI